MKSKINIPKSFFSFLIASVLMWLLINLSKEYTTTVRYSVVYKKLPQHKVFQEEPIKEIALQVKASGFKLFSSNFKSKDLVLYLDKLRFISKNQYYILPKNQKEIIQEQLYSGLKLERILKDTISLNLGSFISKKVPVFADVIVNYKHGYDSSFPIKVTPDSVLISGPKLQLAKVDNIKTKKVELDNVSKNQETVLKVAKPKEFKDIKISHKEVKVNIEVDEFTEGEFLIPFTIENLPYGTTINTFPKKVKIVYKVGLSNYNNITANSFKIVCDYKESKENDLSYLLPKLTLKPNLVSSVRLVPAKIEFLIQK